MSVEKLTTRPEPKSQPTSPGRSSVLLLLWKTVAPALATSHSSEPPKALWEKVKTDLEVVLPLTDEAWGQRHFIGRLPGGVLVDIVQLLSQDQVSA